MPATYRGNVIYVTGASTSIPGPIDIVSVTNKSGSGFEISKLGDGANIPMYQPGAGADHISVALRSATGITVVINGGTGAVILELAVKSNR